MSKQKKQYDTKKLFLQGLLAFGSIFGGSVTPHRYTKDEFKRRKRGHEKFKSQCAARRLQRRLQG